MKKILIIYEPDVNKFELSYIDETIRAYSYEYNKPMYDGNRWAIVVAEEKSISYGVGLLKDKIIETAKREIDENIELIKNVDKEIYFIKDLKDLEV
ncbi:hypothetical protein [uncultured Clostridium sp.]|uniref:hypothetical protein n=1 Tax=uncultured Clostridium sp. TaxID=59620 RepID=UPI002632B59C|nr:hypothetical protein [uncultured Clostridium sp.]